MPLTGQQIIYLAKQLDQEWGHPQLELFAEGLNVKLDNVASGRTFKERAFRFIDHLNRLVPPRDGEFLESLLRRRKRKTEGGRGRIPEATLLPIDRGCSRRHCAGQDPIR